MNFNEMRFFVRPSITFKSDGSYRGHKGVGATFLAYGYTSFTVYTKKDDFKLGAALNGGRQWAEATTQNISRPKFSDVPFRVPELEGAESGTCIEIVIGPHRDERPSLSWLNITNPDTWFRLLRLRTPLGGVYLKTGGIKPIYHISVIVQSGETRSATYEPQDAEFYYPHEFKVCVRHQDLESIQSEVKKA